jgi:hypothetical protein
MKRRGYLNSRSLRTVGVRAGSDSYRWHYQERSVYSRIQYSISKRFTLRRVQVSMLNNLNRTDNVPLRLSQAHF